MCGIGITTPFRDYLRTTHNIGPKSLLKWRDKIRSFLNTKPTSALSLIEISRHKDALNEIKEYAYYRNLGFERSTEKQKRDPLWDEEWVKGYHVILLFCRDLGIDLLNFEILNPDIFKRGKTLDNNNFATHHMDPKTKISMLVKELLLTDAFTHNEYETIPIDIQMNLIEGMAKIISMRGNGKSLGDGLFEITLKDLEKVFGGITLGGESIIERWIGNKEGKNREQRLRGLKETLRELNHRRYLLKTSQIEKLVKLISEPGFQRFWPVVKKMIENIELALDHDYTGGFIYDQELKRFFSEDELKFLVRVFKI